MKSVVNGFGGGFGRVFGRIVAYLFIGFIIYYLMKYFDIDIKSIISNKIGGLIL